MSQFQPQEPQWQQPQTYYPPQQPPNQFSSYPQQQQWEPPAQPYPPQYQPQMPPQQQQPQYGPPPPPAPKKPGKGKFAAIGCGSLVALVVLIVLIAVIASAGGNSSPAPTSNTAQPKATQPAQQATAAPKPTQAPTQAPTRSPAQIEQAYKASATNITVADLDKDGSNDQGNIVHFTATIASFVKDNSGNTAGANVTDANYSSFIQVGFPAGTDISQLNKDDTLEVWGTDNGTFSGTNAFGATIQEVEVDASYMTDQTTGYHAG